jgi:uncharacterized protein
MQFWKKIGLGKHSRKRLLQVLLSFCLALNLAAYGGAYQLTHYRTPGSWGLGAPKPISSKLPSELGLNYTTHRIPIEPDEWLETWSIPASSTPKGTVILFPGNGGSKAKQLLLPAQVFHDLGYDTWLVDFRGVGGSSGNTTTLGMREAQDVVASVSYAQKYRPQQPLILYGVSMGTAAILKAVAANLVHPDAIILELPFDRLVAAVGSRLQAMAIPTFPMAELTVLWGSIQHRFNGFAHNPVNYATQVKCPTLILHGKLDKWTTLAQIDRLFNNLQGSKQLSIFPKAAHDLLVTIDRQKWTQDLDRFLLKSLDLGTIER